MYLFSFYTIFLRFNTLYFINELSTKAVDIYIFDNFELLVLCFKSIIDHNIMILHGIF